MRIAVSYNKTNEIY